MKRMVLCLTVLLMILASLCSCAERGEDGDGITVVCTSFVQYDWAREIVGSCEGVTLRLLVGGGKDMHSYSPSATDVMTILKSDLLIYTGGVSEAWVDELIELNELDSALCLMACLGDGLKCVQHADEACEHEEAHTHTEVDEHVWLSLSNAARFCEQIKNQLCRIDGENAARYTANYEAYVGSLSALDGDYAALADGVAQKTVVIADRYPFRYLFDEYGLTCYAAFSSCSSESEASFSTVIFLAEKIDELGLAGILITETSDSSLAKTVRENTKAKNAEIYMLHSLQSVTEPEDESYLEIMRDNLETLKQVLK